MQTVGNYLKNGREAKNISLSEVARTTKISKWYLDCLEQDDFDKMPGGPYIKSYISSYAAYIGIEEDEVLKCYESLHSDNTEDEQTPRDEPHGKNLPTSARFMPNGKKSFFLSLAILMLVALGIYYFWPQNQPQTVADVKIKDSKWAQKAGSYAPQTENKITISSKNQNNAHTTEQKDLDKNAKPAAETQNRVQEGSATGDNLSAETLPALQNHQTQQAPRKDSGIAASGLGRTVAADQESAPSSRPARTGVANQVTASPSAADRSAAANQDSASSGYATEPTRAPTLGNIKVMEATACTGVANRSPSGAGQTFNWTTHRVYIWSWIESANHPTSVHHIYFFKGRKISDIELKIRAARWRTWSYKTIADKRFIGPWRVDITSAEGKMLQRIHFDVTDAAIIN